MPIVRSFALALSVVLVMGCQTTADKAAIEVDAKRKDSLCAADYRDGVGAIDKRAAVAGEGPRMYLETGQCRFVTADSVAFRRSYSSSHPGEREP